MGIINKETSFYAKKSLQSIAKYSECLEKYSKNFAQEISLTSKSQIFLDTNVLLRYYSISFTAREKLFSFIKENSNRIIISSQVQYEFLKNREDVIQRFFEQVTNRIPKDFNSDIVNKMKSFLETHKIVLKDYPFVETGIEKYQVELEKLLKKLNETSEQKRKEHINLIFKDKFLDLLNTCNIIENLSHEEIKSVRDDFDILRKNIKPENVDTVLNKTASIFPGLGDIKGKPEYPYGDFIIFHEMMKYMIETNNDIIFLTFDNTKGDWMTKSKTSYLHYIQNMYANTNQIIYILDAERTLGNILNINIESLVEQETNTNDITIKSLTKLSQSHPIFEGVRPGIFTKRFIEELSDAGYNSLSEIEHDLDKGKKAITKYENYEKFNTLGITRTTLRLVNRNYTHNISIRGEKVKFFKSPKHERIRSEFNL